MPRSRPGAPREGSERIAAAVALTGSERKAAALLGISRSQINGVLRGIHGAGQKTTDALAGVGQNVGRQITRVTRSLSAGRTRPQIVQAAREAAKAERRTPGATEAAARAHEQRMRDQGLGFGGIPTTGEAPPAQTWLAEQLRTRQPGAWAEVERRYRAGEMLRTDYYDLVRRFMLASGSGGTESDIADLFSDTSEHDDDDDEFDL